MDRNHSKPVVAIVDHQVDVLNSLTSLANTLDVDVLSYADAKSFLRQIDDLDVSCLIIEMNLPDGTGMGVLKTLKQHDLTIPVIMLSSNSNVPEAVEAMQAGCVDFVEMPFVDRVIVQKIKRALKPVKH